MRNLGFLLAGSFSFPFIFIFLCRHIYLNDLYLVLQPFLNGKLRTFYEKVTEFLKVNK